MKISRRLAASAAIATSLAAGARAAAEPICGARITRQNVVRCVLAASLVVDAQARELDAALGHKLAVSPLLPSNPVLSLNAARRSIPTASAINWDATLSQELEVAGQRGLRRAAAEASIAAESARLDLARREAAAWAWTAFFETLSAREEQRLSRYLQSATQAVSSVARARADSGVTAPVDADVADAAALRSFQATLAADRRVASADALLASALGLDATQAIDIVGELAPVERVVALAAARLPQAAEERPEMLSVEAERRALELRAKSFRRARISNPTLSLFAQNDGFHEHVLGIGLALPIPLPGNVGRTYLGEIAEADALAQRAALERERIARAIRFETAAARQIFDSRASEVAAFTPERVERARRTLQSLGEEVASGRLSVRDAVVAQAALIELLQAEVAAKRAWCLASVDLARAAGVPLEREMP